MPVHVLGVIPARGGSKGIVGKNLREVGGKTLVEWAMEAVRGSELLSDWVVNTDDGEIQGHVTSHRDPSFVWLRPDGLGGDNITTAAVIQQMLPFFPQVTHFVIIQPTSPLRTAHDIDGCLRLLLAGHGDSVVSVEVVEDRHPARMYREVGGLLEPYSDEPPGWLRQGLPPVYHRNGAVYAFERVVIERGAVLGNEMVPYLMPAERSVNIDTELDLKIADLLLRERDEYRELAGTLADPDY